MLTNKEFYTTPFGDLMIGGESDAKLLTEKDREFVSAMLAIITEFWPWSLPPLQKKFAPLRHNVPLYEFRIVRHWSKCNLGNHDSILDIDQLGRLHLEIVTCPLRGGDCPMEGDYNTKNCVCKPKFNSQLSDRELDVMKLYYSGHDEEQIAERLFISIETVRTHKRNSFKKADVHSQGEFFQYAKKNNLFEIN